MKKLILMGRVAAGKTTLTQKELYSEEVAESLLIAAKKVYAGNQRLINETYKILFG